MPLKLQEDINSDLFKREKKVLCGTFSLQFCGGYEDWTLCFTLLQGSCNSLVLVMVDQLRYLQSLERPSQFSPPQHPAEGEGD